MKTVITSRTEAQDAAAKFKKCISASATESKALEWVFPNGEKVTCTTYIVPTSLGTLSIAIPKEWNGRQAHLFALNHPGGTLAPDVEINIPDSIDRKVSGAYVKSGKDILICHRGGFTAYRGKIRKEVSHAYFSKWMYDVRDGDKDARMIGVASLGSPSMSDEIAEFVAAVSDMKSQFKAGAAVEGDAPNKSKPAWRDSDEYEGSKKAAASEIKDYEYLHGPLCNSLNRSLKKLVSGMAGVAVLSNRNVDVALVDVDSGKAWAIFEIKTSASLSAQLYSAVGQLAYYRHRYGGKNTKTYLVLPSETRSELQCGEFLSGIDVGLIFGKNESFQPDDFSSLSDLVSECVRA